jgi:hypothetical protein
MEATTEPAAPPPAGDSAFGRVFGVFFSPGKTFEAIARRPTWLAPLALWLLVSLAISAVLVPRMDFEKMVRDRMEKGGRTVTDEQVQSITERQKPIVSVISYASALILPALVALLTAVILWGAFRAFGWDATFRQSFGATTHAFLPGVLGSILLLVPLMRQEKVDPSAIGDLLRSNLGFLVPRDSKFLHSLLSSIDVFSFWTIALLAIGFAAAARIRKGPAAGLIIALWAVYVLGKAGLASMF